jgi:hypothetical protein
VRATRERRLGNTGADNWKHILRIEMMYVEVRRGSGLNVWMVPTGFPLYL